MSLELEIAIKNGVSRELKRIQNDLNRFNKTANTTSNAVGGLSKSLLGVVASTYALSKAYDSTIKRGLAYNNLLVNQRNSIATLISVTSQNIDSMGKTLTYQDKMNLSLKNSNELMKELTKINANTPQTLGQTAQIFKTMYAPMQKVGASQKDLIFLTEKLAIASKVGGVEFNSLLAGVDGLASGTVLANSDLGRFLSSLGLTNEALKKSENVVELLKDKLKDFKAFDDLDTAVSNLNVQWDTLTGNMTKPIYDKQLEWVKDLTEFVGELNEEFKYLKYLFADPADLKSLDEVDDKIADITRAIAENNKVIKGNLFEDLMNGRLFGEEHYKNNIKDLKKELKEVLEVRKRLTEEDLKSKKDGKLKNTKISTESKKKADYTYGYDFYEAEDSFTKMEDDLEKSLVYQKTLIMTDTTWQDYYTKIGDLDKAWLIESASVMQEHSDLTEQQMQDLLAITKTEFFDKLKDEVASIEPFTFKIDIDTSGFSDMQKDMMRVSSSFDSLSKEQKEYDKSITQTGLSQEQTNAMNEQHTQNQIQGYANLAGAMAGSYKEGSKEARALITIQTALSVAMGITAIANAMANGDGYTAVARGVAVAVALKSYGWKGQGGAGNSSTDYSQTIANANYATDMGVGIEDYDGNFESFIDGLDEASKRLEDFGSVGSSVSQELKALRDASNNNTIVANREADLKDAQNKLEKRKDQFEFTNPATDIPRYIYVPDPKKPWKMKKIQDPHYKGIEKLKQHEYDKWLKNYIESVDESKKALEDAQEARDEASKALTDLLTETIADSLDYSLLDKNQLENLLSDFDLSEYERTLDNINDLAILAKQQGGVLTEQQQKELASFYDGISDVSQNFIKGQDYKGAVDALQDFNDEILKMADNLDDAINSIRGNIFGNDTQASTSDLIRQYNKAINLNDFETASKLATTISNTAFGDTSYLNNDLISSLESAKLKIGIEDEVLNVNIVSSELSTGTTTTPSVIVANQSVTSNDTMETILIELLKTNKRVEAILERIEDNQEQIQG